MFFLREEGTEDSEECRGTHLRGPRSGMSLIRKKGPSAGERWLSQKGAIFLGPLPGWKLCGILDKGWGLEPNKPVFELWPHQLVAQCITPWTSYLNPTETPVS